MYAFYEIMFQNPMSPRSCTREMLSIILKPKEAPSISTEGVATSLLEGTLDRGTLRIARGDNRCFEETHISLNRGAGWGGLEDCSRSFNAHWEHLIQAVLLMSISPCRSRKIVGLPNSARYGEEAKELDGTIVHGPFDCKKQISLPARCGPKRKP